MFTRSILKDGKYEDAIKGYNVILEINPKDVSLLGNKGYALNEVGRFDEAIQCYDKALKIDPNNVMSISNKNFALEHLDS
jgi:tetratricopeptide (TPR) repeat protein